MQIPTTKLYIVALFIVVTTSFLTTPVHAQDTDIRTFEGIRFERPQTPKTYITLQTSAGAITPYTLHLPADPPTLGDYLVVAGSGPYYLYWSQSPGTALEMVSGTGLRRPMSGVEGSSVGSVGYYSNNLQGSQISGGGASGGKSTVLGGQANSTSGYLGSVGGGYSNSVSSTQGVVLGGNDNAVSGYRGVTVSGTNNSVSSNQGVTLGGNSNSQSGNIGFIGAGTNNSGSGNMTTIFGGASNSSSSNLGVMMGGFGNSTSGNRATILGGTNNTSATNIGTIAGGYSNNVDANSGFIGGGASNNSNGGDNPTLFGGANNSLNGSHSCIGGGQSNSASSNHTTVGGGQSNSAASGTHGFSFTGQSNTVTTNHATSLGGSSNTVSGICAVALGGRSITVSTQNSIGMNGGATAMSINTQNIAAIANMNVWLADNDNTPSSLRLFEQYNVAGSIVGANINYVAFRAPASTFNDYNNGYTLPDRVGTALRFLSVAPTPTTTTGTLEWIALPAYDVVAANITAPTLLAAATDDADIIRITSTGPAPGRVVTFRNGVTNGMVVTVRFAGANEIRVSDADANLDLQGAVDFDMNANDSLTLVWDAASTKWIEIGRTVQN